LALALNPAAVLAERLTVEYMDKLTRRAVRAAAQAVWMERHGASLAGACERSGSPALTRYARSIRAAMLKAGV
jgi:hypothetical protein